MVNLFFRAFKCRNRQFVLSFFTTYIRPLVENSSTVWNPHLLKDINLLESIQRKFTKRIPGLRSLEYEERLNVLHLDTLECRRLQNDLVMCFKMLHGYVDCDYHDFFELSADGLQRHRHNQRLKVPKTRLDCRKYSFPCRVVSSFNSLPQEVIDSSSVSMFKKRLKNSDISSFLKYR